MKQSAALAVVGGDVRYVYLASLLAADGHRVHTFALERHPTPGCNAITDLRQGLSTVDAVVLPMPVQHGDGQLNAPLANAPHRLSDVLDAIPASTLTLAGAVPFLVHARAVQNEVHLIDYLSRPELAIRNAVPTCEGAIQIAMEQTEHTLQDCNALVIGFGRIGAMLARKLHALGAKVAVSARSEQDFARIEAEGLLALDTRRLSDCLAPYDLIFNTVPAPVLGQTELAELLPTALVIDLASLPGGIAPDTVIPRGCRVLHALSLPGKVAPLSAARAIHDTILTILHEEGVL